METKKTNLQIVQTISKVLGILCRIGYVFCIVGLAFSIVGLVTLCLITMTTSDLVIRIEQSRNYRMGQLIGSCLIGVVVCMGGLLETKLLKDYFAKELEVGTPFTADGAKALRTVGIFNIAAPLAISIITAILAALFNVNDVVGYDVNLTVGLAMVLLSFVFAYGAELEEQKAGEVPCEN